MKSLLLITVPMSGYELEIINSLERKGFKVDYFKEGSKIDRKHIGLGHRILRSLVNEYHLFFLKLLLENIEKKIYQNHIENLAHDYSCVFDFGGKATETCLKLLKNKYKCDFVIYLWDDLKHFDTSHNVLNYFDKKYIFNNGYIESQAGFKYRPNFFAEVFKYNNEEKVIDIFYKGSARNKYRAEVLQRISNELQNYNLDISLYSKGSYFQNYFKFPNRKYFNQWCKDEYLDIELMAYKAKRSKVLLDITYAGQVGLGLRPIEAIAANCKLITTNSNISNYDFYNDRNIFYLKKDFSNIKDIKNFVDSPFYPYDSSVKFKYSIDGFMDELFKDYR